MTAFGIPDNPIADTMQAHGMTWQNGWAMAIEQCPTLAALAALEDRIYRAIERARDRGMSVEAERERLDMCHARRVALLLDGEQPGPKWLAKTPYHERRQILDGIPPASEGDVVRP